MSDYVPNLDAMASMQFDIPKDTEKWLEWQARTLAWAFQHIDEGKKNIEAVLLELAQTRNVEEAAKHLASIMTFAMNTLAYISYYQGTNAMPMDLVAVTARGGDKMEKTSDES